MRVPPFLFIRHGETDWNVEGRLQGRQDIGLNRLGRDQAAEAGRRAAELLGREGFPLARVRLVVSPLGRTRETAAVVRAAMGLQPGEDVLDPRLREISFGDWEGLTWRDVKARHPEALRDRRRDRWRFAPPGGGESYAHLVERVRPWLAEVNENDVVVSHGGVARALMVLVGGASILAAPQADILQGRVLRFAKGGYAWL